MIGGICSLKKSTRSKGTRGRGSNLGEGKMEPETPKRSIADFSTEEVRVLKLLRQGQTRDAIARELGISGSELTTRIHHILASIRAPDRAALLDALAGLTPEN